MISTIRTCARFFKFGKSQIPKLKKNSKRLLKLAKTTCTQLIHRLKDRLKRLFVWYQPKPNQPPILLPAQAISHKKISSKQKKNKPSKGKISRRTKRRLSSKTEVKKTEQVNEPCSKVHKLRPQQSLKEAIQDFYEEWEASFGPALTSLDKKFLESAHPDIAYKVMENGRLTLKSPYLKAVYNGLKDLEDISDLLINDEQAKQKVLSVFQDFYEQGPDVFYRMLDIFHDKGDFPTRSGLRRLSLDTRLMPSWLGFAHL